METDTVRWIVAGILFAGAAVALAKWAYDRKKQ